MQIFKPFISPADSTRNNFLKSGLIAGSCRSPSHLLKSGAGIGFANSEDLIPCYCKRRLLEIYARSSIFHDQQSTHIRPHLLFEIKKQYKDVRGLKQNGRVHEHCYVDRVESYQSFVCNIQQPISYQNSTTFFRPASTTLCCIFLLFFEFSSKERFYN
jgi:hypothetical protein